ncbi:hypothetical protein PARC_a2259 [Pseudoalteromonas arctica A 37-1-2]|uniref:Uncharacterized protein n=1 Tax=Pseudoalteromonas arctica A 37-1-2 TaxID=1117313 RepID=A0A290S5G7_9GAMM|nr:hypothetical protein PARC_a2259 [Pseudoalteromonas arctica A 37-1-2]
MVKTLMMAIPLSVMGMRKRVIVVSSQIDVIGFSLLPKNELVIIFDQQAVSV